MADAGFGGAEIADVHHSVRVDMSSETHGWGTKPWQDAVEAALDQAQKRGLSIDHSIGPSWPAASCLITPDHPGATKELVTVITPWDSSKTFDGEIPAPDTPKSGAKAERYALQAALLSAGSSATDKEMSVDGDSLIDLTDAVSNGVLHWKPTQSGSWIILSYWLRGSAQQPEGGPHTKPESFVVDHFSQAGTQAVKDLWKQKVLTPKIEKLIASVGGNLFEDSIEMETHETLWTPLLLEEFEKRRGYSLLPYLPLVVQKKEDHIIDFEGFDSGHIRHDWWQTLSELFLENHFEALKTWARSLGLGFRGQPYGLRTDAIRAAATLDIAEGESLGFKNLDDYRSLAGGRDMGGNKILSNEAGAFAGSAYGTTWKRVLRTLNPQFAAGVNQSVLHGFAYAEAPTAKWPGFAAFSPYHGRTGYSEAWGPRQPSWQHINDISGYFSRVHLILQQGQPQVDVAFLRQKGYAGSGFGAPWFSKIGVSKGWTHEFISPSTLELPTAKVRNGMLNPDGAAFQLLVFEGDAFHGRKSTFELPAAKRLLALAQAGLPILAVGDWSDPMLSGKRNSEAEKELKAIFSQLLSLKNVANVLSRENIESGVKELGISPRLTHSQAEIVHAERLTDSARYFYFCNNSEKDEQETMVQIPKQSQLAYLYQMDLWTGEIQELASNDAESDATTFEMKLSPRDSKAYVLTKKPLPGISVLETSHSNQDPNSLVLKSWILDVESWIPGDSPSKTIKVKRSTSLDTLPLWSELQEFTEDSGLLTYSCEFEANLDLARSQTATLVWEQLFDTVQITLNGRKLPPHNPLKREVELEGYLKTGKNRLSLQTSTTLNNRLRVFNPSVYGDNKLQLYGISGTVKVTW